MLSTKVKKKSRSTTKRRSKSLLIRLADAAFSKHIRSKDAVDGIAECVTCSLRKPWKELQAGHFVSRSKHALRYAERNVHVQCYRCNVLLKGNYPIYALFLQRKYGDTILEDLYAETFTIKKWSTSELEEMIETWTKKTLKIS